jgi:hypothetical protein
VLDPADMGCLTQFLILCMMQTTISTSNSSTFACSSFKRSSTCQQASCVWTGTECRNCSTLVTEKNCTSQLTCAWSSSATCEAGYHNTAEYEITRGSSYKRAGGNTCASVGMVGIATQSECAHAAVVLGLSQTTPGITYNHPNTYGCSWGVNQNGEQSLQWNNDPADIGKGTRKNAKWGTTWLICAKVSSGRHLSDAIHV